MVRTVIPAKLLDTVEIGHLRANLRRWEHYPGETPVYTIEIWHGWHLKICDEYEGKPERRWANMGGELAVVIAKQAMGMGFLGDMAAPDNVTTLRRKLRDDAEGS